MSAPSASGTGVLNKPTEFGATSAVTSTNLNAHVDNAVFNANAIDDSTISINASGKLFVKDVGIGSSQLATDSVITAKIADDAITSALIADNIALGGNPTTTTQAASNSSTRIATTAYVRTEIPNMFTPSTYGGEESITLPNGLIIKTGTKDVTNESSPYTLTFGSAFTNALVSAQVTQLLNSNSLQSPCHLKSIATTNIVVAFDTDVTHLHYLVIGR
tara:strand:+ start:2574 stop:3227 length:654 start_codon:yes stop_codon:yes gene_type:complete